MKIFEILSSEQERDYESTKEEYGIEFEPVEDLIVFMKNDPVFYRRKYFPRVKELEKNYKKNKEVDPKKYFSDVVDSAMNTYCKKYDLARDPSEIFSSSDKHEIIGQITSEEIENIRNGEYKK